MPDGDTHLRIWKRFIPLAVAYTIGLHYVLFITLSINPLWGVVTLLGYLLGRYISPDWDLIGITSDEGRLMRELKILGLLVVIWALPYAYIMKFVGIGRKGHRNFFSHFPIVSTVIRMAWVFGFPVLLLLNYYPAYWYPTVLSFLLLTAGMIPADTFHYIADTISGKGFITRWMFR